MKQVEYVDPADGRHLAFTMFHPAAPRDSASIPYHMVYFMPGFGMDAAGRRLTIPTHIIVGARDTQAPPKDNSEFAAQYVPHARLDVLPGLVDHEIFVNECDALGRDTWPEACIDAPGIGRAKLHEYIGNAALKFFDVNLGMQRDNVN